MSKLNKIVIITSLIGLAVIVIVIISGSSYPDPFFSYGTAIEMLMIFLLVLYDNNISVSMVDGSLVGRLYGSSYTDLRIKNISVDHEGASSNYIFYRVSDTIWDDISTSKNMMTEYVICPEEKSADMVERVYYYTGDFSDLENMNEEELQMVIQNSILLWEKMK